MKSLIWSKYHPLLPPLTMIGGVGRVTSRLNVSHLLDSSCWPDASLSVRSATQPCFTHWAAAGADLRDQWVKRCTCSSRHLAGPFLLITAMAVSRLDDGTWACAHIYKGVLLWNWGAAACLIQRHPRPAAENTVNTSHPRLQIHFWSGCDDIENIAIISKVSQVVRKNTRDKLVWMLQPFLNLTHRSILLSPCKETKRWRADGKKKTQQTHAAIFPY